jgi:hypothetical protein
LLAGLMSEAYQLMRSEFRSPARRGDWAPRLVLQVDLDFRPVRLDFAQGQRRAVGPWAGEVGI